MALRAVVATPNRSTSTGNESISLFEPELMQFDFMKHIYQIFPCDVYCFDDRLEKEEKVVVLLDRMRKDQSLDIRKERELVGHPDFGGQANKKPGADTAAKKAKRKQKALLMSGKRLRD